MGPEIMHTESTSKIPQKERVGSALENLMAVKRRGDLLMERLMNGDVPTLTEGDKLPPPQGTVFISLWDSLPAAINETAEHIDDIFTELDSRLLK